MDQVSGDVWRACADPLQPATAGTVGAASAGGSPAVYRPGGARGEWASTAAGGGVHPLTLPGRCFKAVVDVVLALALLVLCLPVILLAAVAIRLDSSGPVLFRQDRLGAGGRRFRLYKFRTMTVAGDDRHHMAYVAAMIAGCAEPVDGMYKLVDDPRITPVGRLLRRFSIDELPQLWNVLRGDMSLIGPRPPMPSEAELYEGWMWRRLAGKPGITGLWQVSGRCQLTFREMVELDIAYWEEWTPSADLRILLRSIPAVLSAKGAA